MHGRRNGFGVQLLWIQHIKTPLRLSIKVTVIVSLKSLKTAFISFANELPVVFVAAGMAVIPMGKLGAWVVSGYW